MERYPFSHRAHHHSIKHQAAAHSHQHLDQFHTGAGLVAHLRSWKRAEDQADQPCEQRAGGRIISRCDRGPLELSRPLAFANSKQPAEHLPPHSIQYAAHHSHNLEHARMHYAHTTCSTTHHTSHYSQYGHSAQHHTTTAPRHLTACASHYTARTSPAEGGGHN